MKYAGFCVCWVTAGMESGECNKASWVSVIFSANLQNVDYERIVSKGILKLQIQQPTYAMHCCIDTDMSILITIILAQYLNTQNWLQAFLSLNIHEMTNAECKSNDCPQLEVPHALDLGSQPAIFILPKNIQQTCAHSLHCSWCLSAGNRDKLPWSWDTCCSDRNPGMAMMDLMALSQFHTHPYSGAANFLNPLTSFVSALLLLCMQVSFASRQVCEAVSKLPDNTDALTNTKQNVLAAHTSVVKQSDCAGLMALPPLRNMHA